VVSPSISMLSHTLDEMLQHMEAMATQVWPRVEAGEE
jgi:hypothetical protein